MLQYLQQPPSHFPSVENAIYFDWPFSLEEDGNFTANRDIYIFCCNLIFAWGRGGEILEMICGIWGAVELIAAST